MLVDEERFRYAHEKKQINGIIFSFDFFFCFSFVIISLAR
jgi:hypothetical protein